LISNNTWQLASAYPGKNVVGCKWIFKTKHHADGMIEWHKARLVAKGFSQCYGLGYVETFSSVIKPTTIHLILSIAVSKGWTIRQVDVKNVFLNCDLQETVYMSQPPGFISTNHPHHVCKLQKAIYGLKQAPRSWHSTLSSKLYALHFQSCKTDTSLFIYKTAQLTMYILVYVDDLIIVSSSPSSMSHLLRQLDSAFAIKDLGPLHYFLGIELFSSHRGLILSQRRYIAEILEKTNMMNCRPVSTPMSSSKKISRHTGHRFALRMSPSFVA
jgi:hypothetical protein